MELDFGARLNIITGDNGLGKSFLLDIIWWALTRHWPAELNPLWVADRKALPNGEPAPAIRFTFQAKSKDEQYSSTFSYSDQVWTGRAGRPANPGLVIFAMSAGSFCVWDPHRNDWRTQEGVDVQDRIPAYVFSPKEIWDGLPGTSGSAWLCNGLLRDWAVWQSQRGASFERLRDVVAALSPSPSQHLEIGALTRISLDDSRDIPTIRMPYGRDVSILHASSGIRRVVSLAYLLVWAWQEHLLAAQQRKEAPTPRITFLIDELDAHLHPAWQCSIVSSLLAVITKLQNKSPEREMELEMEQEIEVQLIAATHSPFGDGLLGAHIQSRSRCLV
jgi:hypothetical protein